MYDRTIKKEVPFPPTEMKNFLYDILAVYKKYDLSIGYDGTTCLIQRYNANNVNWLTEAEKDYENKKSRLALVNIQYLEQYCPYEQENETAFRARVQKAVNKVSPNHPYGPPANIEIDYIPEKEDRQ